MSIRENIDKVLVTEEQIRVRSKELGEQITKDYENEGSAPLLVALLRGSVPFLAELIKHIDLDIQYDFMDVTSYEGTISTGNVKILKDLDIEVLSMKEAGIEADIVEDGKSFEENAVIKAESILRKTGCASIADDSGLAVDALGGRPGVHSARYCGVHGDDEANNQLLLKELSDKPAPHKAHYGAALALCRPGREPVIVYGRCDGEIIGEYRGEGGFGYDPLFLSDDLGVTFAEADPQAKNGVSHRARAIQKLIAALEGEA